MLAIKKRAARGAVFWAAVTGGFLLSGCAPPGPRALLEGEKLIREEKYGQAVEKLELATRLLPRHAPAWNHLGLAYHGQQKPEQALRAYRKALSLDHKLASTRYNLGCLFLEQNNATAAVDELTSYTLLQSRSLDGWLKLGSAQLRARRLDSAERSFKNALELHPRHPEALNGLGVIQLQRKRVPDALYCFNLALAQNPRYSPALLNLAVVTHQSLNNRSLALQKYREYLALQPRPANWEAVDATARRLELELNPPRLLSTNLAAPGAARTNLAPDQVPTTSPVKAVAALARTNPASPAQPAKSTARSQIVDRPWPSDRDRSRAGDVDPRVL